jgi:hypothetical protein
MFFMLKLSVMSTRDLEVKRADAGPAVKLCRPIRILAVDFGEKQIKARHLGRVGDAGDSRLTSSGGVTTEAADGSGVLPRGGVGEILLGIRARRGVEARSRSVSVVRPGSSARRPSPSVSRGDAASARLPGDCRRVLKDAADRTAAVLLEDYLADSRRRETGGRGRRRRNGERRTAVLRVFLLLALLGVAVAAYFSYGSSTRRASRRVRPGEGPVPVGTPTANLSEPRDGGRRRDARLAEIYRVYRAGAAPGRRVRVRPADVDRRDHQQDGQGRRRAYGRRARGLTAEETFELFWKQGVSGPEAFTRRSRTRNCYRVCPEVSDLEVPLPRRTSSRSTCASDRRPDGQRQFGRTSSEMREKRDLGLSPRQAVTLASIIGRSALKSVRSSPPST